MRATIPREVDFLETAPLRATLVRTIRGTPDAVFAVLADNERWPEWFAFFRECRTTSAAGVGGTRHVDAGGMKVDERFLAWEPGRAWVFTLTTCRPRVIRSLVEGAWLEPAGPDATRITWRIGVEFAAPLRWLSPLLRWHVARMTGKLIDGLDARMRRGRHAAIVQPRSSTEARRLEAKKRRGGRSRS